MTEEINLGPKRNECNQGENQDPAMIQMKFLSSTHELSTPVELKNAPQTAEGCELRKQMLVHLVLPNIKVSFCYTSGRKVRS